MRLQFILLLVLVMVIGGILVHRAPWREPSRLAAHQHPQPSSEAGPADERLQRVETLLQELRAEMAMRPGNASPARSDLGDDVTRRLQKIEQLLSQRPGGRPIPEYDATNPQPTTSHPPPRSWGFEQAIGPPDTERGADAPTAWATREPDAGPEWLSVGFQNAVEIAEVRVRESFNPGAIIKVTAVINDQEHTLWEGVAHPGPAPRDFVVRVNEKISAQALRVHLDTALVTGWNEIDAVELVGRDGSRQWADSANASSTYAGR